MTVDRLALQALQRGLESWRGTIERSTGGKLSLVLHVREGLKCEVTWEKDGVAASFKRVFATPPIDRRSCANARAIIQAVLQQRGVIS